MTQTTKGVAKRFQEPQWVKSEGETTKANTTWVSKLSETFKKVVGGTYQITWSCTFYVKVGTKTRCEVRLMVDSVQAGAGETQDGDTNEQQVGGTLYKSFSDGAEPEVSIDFRMQGDPGTAAVKRAYIGIVRVGD